MLLCIENTPWLNVYQQGFFVADYLSKDHTEMIHVKVKYMA